MVRAGHGDVDQEGQYTGEPGVSLSREAMLGRRVFSALTSSIQKLVDQSWDLRPVTSDSRRQQDPEIR